MSINVPPWLLVTGVSRSSLTSRNARISSHLIKTLRPKLNVQWFYHTSKGYLNHSVVAYNSMAYDLFSSPIKHLVYPMDAVDPRKQDGVVYKIRSEYRCVHERVK